jgi:hypothetical protein
MELVMNQDRKNEKVKVNDNDDLKMKMLDVLAKKRMSQNLNKSSESTKGSKVGAGNSLGAAPKMHRRKAGSA